MLTLRLFFSNTLLHIQIHTDKEGYKKYKLAAFVQYF